MTTGNNRPILVPRPREYRRLNGHFVLTQATQMTVRGERSRARFTLDRLTRLIQDEFGLTFSGAIADSLTFEALVSNDGPPNGSSVTELPAREGAYALTCTPTGIHVSARDWSGLFYGAMTLWQLMSQSQGAVAVPACHIVDWPHYHWRGFMIDSGRAPNSLPKIKRIIRICSTLKLNMMLFREADDELNAVRYRNNPLGSENPHAFTMEQMGELITYAGEYGITVVPEIESLGHAAARRRHYPHLIQGGIQTQYPGVGEHTRKSNYDINNPQTYELLAEIYEEWMPLLSSPLLHIGLDEVRLPPEAQSEHLHKLLPMLLGIAEKHDKRLMPIIWDDAPPTPVEYQDRVIRCLWSYGEAGEIDRNHPQMANQQHLVSLSSVGCTQKVLMVGGSGATHEPYGKDDPRLAIHNLSSWSRWGSERENFIGLLAGQWGGNMTDLWLTDFACAGDFAWNPPPEASTIQSACNCLRIYRELLNRLKDAHEPNPDEVDRPAWYGIWLPARRWEAEVVPSQRTKEMNG
ncbi:MAG: family 20 glycosylhydrolase [Phycisphaeraceae bacterium]|nr:family 20 glycosylhydrolase [Phycisphaeraceae bacterium]